MVEWPTPESGEHPPRNILTHLNETLLAMSQVESWEQIYPDMDPAERARAERANAEGDAVWLNRQLNVSGPYTVKGTLERYQAAGKNDGNCAGVLKTACVYGSGGYNRWFFTENGTVRFSEHHAMEPGKKRAEFAKSLGFEVF